MNLADDELAWTLRARRHVAPRWCPPNTRTAARRSTPTGCSRTSPWPVPGGADSWAIDDRGGPSAAPCQRIVPRVGARRAASEPHVTMTRIRPICWSGTWARSRCSPPAAWCGGRSPTSRRAPAKVRGPAGAPAPATTTGRSPKGKRDDGEARRGLRPPRGARGDRPSLQARRGWSPRASTSTGKGRKSWCGTGR